MNDQVRGDPSSDHGAFAVSDDDIDLMESSRDGLAIKLGELYEASSPRERAMLVHVLYRAMDPIARAEIAKPDLFSPEQEAVLSELDLLTDGSRDG